MSARKSLRKESRDARVIPKSPPSDLKSISCCTGARNDHLSEHKDARWNPTGSINCLKETTDMKGTSWRGTGRAAASPALAKTATNSYGMTGSCPPAESRPRRAGGISPAEYVGPGSRPRASVGGSIAIQRRPRQRRAGRDGPCAQLDQAARNSGLL